LSRSGAQITEAFRATALRPTPQRYAVLEFLAEKPVHATADEIWEAVNRAFPRASRATVYNSLKSLTHAGLVREVASEGKAARFDANLHRHHHFVCDGCGGVEDIPWFDLPAGPEGSAQRKALGSRSVRSFELVVRGYCVKCRHFNPQTGERL
jgi:Fur family transcriptional regulator, peroxide stress response regulator